MADLPARWKQAKELGWTRAKFDNSSPDDLRAAILMAADDDLTAVMNEALGASGDAIVEGLNPSEEHTVRVKKAAMYAKKIGVQRLAGEMGISRTTYYLWRSGEWTGDKSLDDTMRANIDAFVDKIKL
jgi:hypothetical protein